MKHNSIPIFQIVGKVLGSSLKGVSTEQIGELVGQIADVSLAIITNSIAAKPAVRAKRSSGKKYKIVGFEVNKTEE